MKNLFTYPNNSGSYYIDPAHIGDGTYGVSYRVDELITGNYADWPGATPKFQYDITWEDITPVMSRYINYFNNERDLTNLSQYDFYKNPMITISTRLNEWNIDTAYDSASLYGTPGSILTVRTEDYHAVWDGIEMYLNSFTSDTGWQELENNKMYAKRHPTNLNLVEFYLDEELTEPVIPYLRAMDDGGVTTTSGDPEYNSAVVFHHNGNRFQDGMPVRIFDFDGTVHDIHQWDDNATTYYVQELTATSCNLSTDPAGLDLLGNWDYAYVDEAGILEYTLAGDQVSIKIDTTEDIDDEDRFFIKNPIVTAEFNDVVVDWERDTVLYSADRQKFAAISKVYSPTAPQTVVTISIYEFNLTTEDYELDHTDTVDITAPTDEFIYSANDDLTLISAMEASGTDSATLYVFENTTATTWTLMDSQVVGGVFSVFGSCAMSGDGSTVVVTGNETYPTVSDIVLHIMSISAGTISITNQVSVGGDKIFPANPGGSYPERHKRNMLFVNTDGSRIVACMTHADVTPPGGPTVITPTEYVVLFNGSGTELDNAAFTSTQTNHQDFIINVSPDFENVVVVGDDSDFDVRLLKINANDTITTYAETGIILPATFGTRPLQTCAVSSGDSPTWRVTYTPDDGAGGQDPDTTRVYSSTPGFPGTNTLHETIVQTGSGYNMNFHGVFIDRYDSPRGRFNTIESNGTATEQKRIAVRGRTHIDAIMNHIHYNYNILLDERLYVKTHATLPDYWTLYKDEALTVPFDYTVEIPDETFNSSATHLTNTAHALVNINEPIVQSTTGRMYEEVTGVSPAWLIVDHAVFDNVNEGRISPYGTEVFPRYADTITTWLPGIQDWTGESIDIEGFYRPGVSGRYNVSSLCGDFPPVIDFTLNAEGYIIYSTLPQYFQRGKFHYSVGEVLVDFALPEQAGEPTPVDDGTQWRDFGDNAAKRWPEIAPRKAAVIYNMPSSKTNSAFGTKYVLPTGRNKWSIEFEYPPLTESQFREIYAVAHAVQGVSNPFYLPLIYNGEQILWDSPTDSPDQIRFRKQEIDLNDNTIIEAGLKTFLVDGFAANQSPALTAGDVINAEANINGGLSVVVNTVDANVFGESQMTIASPLEFDHENGEIINRTLDACVVTLADNDFTYVRRLDGLYDLTVRFNLDKFED